MGSADDPPLKCDNKKWNCYILITFPLFIRSDAHRFDCAFRSAPRLVEARLTHRGERVCASVVASAFHRAARFTLGAAYALRAIPYGKGYNSTGISGFLRLLLCFQGISCKLS